MPSSKKYISSNLRRQGPVPSTSRTGQTAIRRIFPQRVATPLGSTAEVLSAQVAPDVAVSRPEVELVATSDANVMADMYPDRDMSPSRVSRGLLESLGQGP